MFCTAICSFFILLVMFMTLFEEAPGLTTAAIIILAVVAFYSYNKGLDNKNKKIKELENSIDNDKSVSWSDVFTMNFSGNKDVIKRIIKEGIEKGLFVGKLTNSDYVKPFIDVISEETLKYLDNLAISNDLQQYNFVDITRSSNEKINNGTYVYIFNDDNNLVLLKAPFNIVSGNEGKKYPAFSSDLVSDNYIINKDSIKDFQYFGSQLLETNISTGDDSKVVDTMLSELLFGSSYTILKGINKMESKHTIRDARVVQMIFDDQSDIEFSGISIFYDLNRKFGIVKNKEIENSELLEKISHSENKKLSNKSVTEQLREYKELFDENIITEAEFNAKKKELLNL